MPKRKTVIIDLFINKGYREKHIAKVYNKSCSEITKLLLKWKIRHNVSRKNNVEHSTKRDTRKDKKESDRIFFNNTSLGGKYNVYNKKQAS